jgi:hypothetical protein
MHTPLSSTSIDDQTAVHVAEFFRSFRDRNKVRKNPEIINAVFLLRWVVAVQVPNCRL